MWLSYIDVFLHFYFVIWKSYSSAYLLRHRKLADDLRIPTSDVTKRAFRRSLGLKCEDVLLHTDKTLQRWERVNQEIIVLIWNYRWKSQLCMSSLTFCIQQVFFIQLFLHWAQYICLKWLCSAEAILEESFMSWSEDIKEIWIFDLSISLDFKISIFLLFKHLSLELQYNYSVFLSGRYYCIETISLFNLLLVILS